MFCLVNEYEYTEVYQPINCQWKFILITILKSLSQLRCSNNHVVGYNWKFEHEG